MNPNPTLRRFGIAALALAWCVPATSLASDAERANLETGVSVGREAAPEITLDELERMAAYRAKQLEPIPGVRSNATGVAMLNVATEVAIRDTAAELGIGATESEVESFLLPLLTYQGLVNPVESIDFASDENIARWLSGQHWTYDDLYASAETLLLWTKVATRDVEITDDDVRAYVESHPRLGVIPAAVKIEVKQFDTIAEVTRGGVEDAEALGPFPDSVARGKADRQLAPLRATKDWRGLELYLALERLDPELRGELSGRTVGDPFGPVELRNGSIVAGTVVAAVPELSVADSDAFGAYARFVTRLDKADQKDAFETLIARYVASIQDTQVRGALKDLFTVVGGGIGASFGGAGAPIGGMIGGMVGTWFEGEVTPQLHRQAAQYPSFPPMNPQMGRTPPYFPAMNYRAPSSYMTRGYRIPQMPSYYRNGFSNYMAAPPRPYGNYFAPPVSYPMPVGAWW